MVSLKKFAGVTSLLAALLTTPVAAYAVGGVFPGPSANAARFKLCLDVDFFIDPCGAWAQQNK